jgi:hypothetical protein
MRGVAIILSPWFKRAYERAGRQPPIYLDRGNPEFVGRFIGITVAYPNHDSYGKRFKGDSRLFIASAYLARYYINLKVKLQIGSEKQEIPQSVGVRQGDPLSPVLFLFIISAVSEVLQTEFAPCVAYRKVEDGETTTEGQLISHAPKTLSRGEVFSIIDLYFVDDGAFPFPTRDAIVRGAPIVDETLKRVDLLMHVGTELENGEETKAKTECVFYPPPGFLDPITIQPELDLTITDVLVIKQKRESC